MFSSLKDLSEFIQLTTTGLSVEVGEGDYDGLVNVMIHLLAVKERQTNTDVMFEPLKETVELLSAYTQETADEVMQQLEVGVYNIKLCCLNNVRYYSVSPLRNNMESNCVFPGASRILE